MSSAYRIWLSRWCFIILFYALGVFSSLAQDLQAVRWYGGHDLLDLSTGQWVTQAKFLQLRRLSNGYYLAKTRKQQFIVINHRGQQCTRRYSNIIPVETQNGQLRGLLYRKGRYWGLMSPEGRDVTSAIFDRISILPHTGPTTEALLLQTERKGRLGLMRPDGQTLVSNRLLDLQPVSNGVVIAQEAASGLWGAVDTNGNEVIAFAYDALRVGGAGCSNSDSLAQKPIFIARQEQQWGVLMADQSLSQPILMDSIRQACGTFALGWIGDEPKLVAGLNSYPATAAVQLPYGRIAFSRHEREWGIYDTPRRKFILPCRYRQVQPFGTQRYQVQDADGKWGWVDTVGKVILPCRYDTIIPFNPITFYHQVQRYLFDNAWAKRVPLETDLWMEWARNSTGSTSFHQLYWVEQVGRWGLVDSTGLSLVSPATTPITGRWKVGYFGAGMGLMGYDGLPLTRMDFQAVLPLNDRHTLLRKDNRLFLFNFDLNTTIATPYDAILATSTGYLVVRKGGKWGVLRPDESVLLECVHQRLRLSGGVQLDESGSIVIRDTLRTQQSAGAVQYFLVNIIKDSDELVVVDSLLFHFQPSSIAGLNNLVGLSKDYLPVVYEGPPKVSREVSDALMPVADGVWFLIFPDGEPQYPYPITGYYRLTPDKLAIRQDGRWGIYDLRRHRLVVLPEYSGFIYPKFGREKLWGYMGAVRDGHIAILDTNGAAWTAASYSAMRPLLGLAGVVMRGRLLLQSARQWSLIDGDKLQNEAILADSLVPLFADGRALPYYLTRRGQFWGVVDVNGVEVLAPEWEELRYEKGVFIVGAGGLWAMADSVGHVLLPLEYVLLKRVGGLVTARKRVGGVGLVDVGGRIVVPLAYEDIVALRSGAGSYFFRVRRGGLYGLLDGSGRVVVDCIYSWMADTIRGGVLEVRDGTGLSGLVDVYGNVVLGLKYRLPYLSGGVWGVEYGGEWALMDSTGGWLSDFEFEEVYSVGLKTHTSPASGEVAKGRRGLNEPNIPPRPTDTPLLQGGELKTHTSPDSGEVAEGRRGLNHPPAPSLEKSQPPPAPSLERRGVLCGRKGGLWGVLRGGEWLCLPKFSGVPGVVEGRYCFGVVGGVGRVGVWDMVANVWVVEPVADSVYVLGDYGEPTPLPSLERNEPPPAPSLERRGVKWAYRVGGLWGVRDGMGVEILLLYDGVWSLRSGVFVVARLGRFRLLDGVGRRIVPYDLEGIGEYLPLPPP